ncbi:MAG: ribonuclease D [Rhodospirillaceae bacterium]
MEVRVFSWAPFLGIRFRTCWKAGASHTSPPGALVANHVHQGDLPSDITFSGAVAVDTETMGLSIARDRLCVVQLSAGDGECHLVQVRAPYDAPNLKAIFTDKSLTKIFHFARFDLAMILKHLGVRCEPAFCTRTVSKLCRTNTDRHGLKDLCRDYLGIEISKQQQSSDWAAETLKPEQIEYAAADVLYLHKLMSEMNYLLDREGRRDLAEACFRFLPDRAALDVAGWPDEDIFAH